MMRSLYSGISGLRNHQTRMDVIGNNIANVNTTGYKTSRVIFQDIFSQNISSGMANNNIMPGAPGAVGGTNPIQIGLGIRLSSIDVMHTPASFQRTDNPTDMMINGDGYFIVQGPEGPFYTRAGNFNIDNEGYLVNSLGFYVLGYNFEMITGVVDPGRAAVGTVGEPGYLPPIPPTFGLVPGNPINDEYEGGLSRIRLVAQPRIPPSPLPDNPLLAPPIPEPTPPALLALINGDGTPANPGWPAGMEVSLPGFSVAENGDISVVISERKLVIGTVAIAMFANPPGLEKAGNSLYRASASSGPVVRTTAYFDGAGKIDGSGLEMSNVDLASEFTDMIVTQRGFQANSRIITVSDTMLEELVNLKR